jgi:hypothetical protein
MEPLLIASLLHPAKVAIDSADNDSALTVPIEILLNKSLMRESRCSIIMSLLAISEVAMSEVAINVWTNDDFV